MGWGPRCQSVCLTSVAGGFGQATLDFLQELVETAGEQSSADLYHWSAMVFGEQWG
jgi:hypothetical protein